MSSGVYNGSSEGFLFLTEGYIDYSKEVIENRAIPDLRDGFKPVQRRILYSSYKNKLFQMQKAVVIVSEALKLHPHGDQALYGAMTLLTAPNESWQMPLFDGKGNLGHVYSSKPPAAMRYPKVCLNEHAKDFFREADVMDMVVSEEGDGEEPTVINSIYPNILVNGSMGIAVSVGTRIPSFNLGDVVDLTCKYIQDGHLELSDIIYPDFTTGGVLVKNDSEVAKIMATGVGKLKVRAKVEIVGKEIIVREVPVGKTFESIIKAIDEADIRDVVKAMDLSDKDSGGCVSISCRTRKSVESVLLELYRRNILQSVYPSKILVVMNGEPLMLGVHDLIKRWVAWRKTVLSKKFIKASKDISEEKATLGYFIRLIQNDEWRDKYVDMLVHSRSAKKDCDAYLQEIFEDIPKSVCDWIYERQGNAFNNGGRYLNRLETLNRMDEEFQYNLRHEDEYIIKELQDLKRKYAGKTKRRTEITNKDYRFSKIVDSDDIVDVSACFYTLKKDGYLAKTREPLPEEEKDNILCQFEATASSLLVGFDNFGRVIRFLGTDIPFTYWGDKGTYMPKFLEATFDQSYKLLYLCECNGERKMLVYKDGYVGFFDTSEWIDKKVVKYTNKGVDVAVRDQLLQIYEQNEIPDVLILGSDKEKHVKFGVVITENIPVRSRTSRAKVLSGTNLCTEYIYGCSYMDGMSYLKNLNAFIGKMKVVHEDDVVGELELMADGAYLDMNVEL